MSKKKYTAKDIVVLEASAHIRKRPAMYLGSTDSEGLLQTLLIILENSVDEAYRCQLPGQGQVIVTLHTDGSIAVEDNGPGIPFEEDKKTGKSILEKVFTILGACYCGCAGQPGHRRQRGVNSMRSETGGMPAVVANAVSEWLTVETTRRFAPAQIEGQRVRMSFQEGELVEDLQELGPSLQRGTIVHFQPDPSIFDKDAKIDRDKLLDKFQEIIRPSQDASPSIGLRLIDVPGEESWDYSVRVL